MKIGIETECLSQTIRGIGNYTLTVIEALKHQQIDLTCYHTKKVHIDGVKNHRYFPRPPLPFINSFASLFHHRCFDKVDLIHFPEPKILYGIKPKVPVVITIHDVMPLLFPAFFSKKSRMMMEKFLPRYLQQADAIIAVSQQTKKDLLHFFSISENKIHVVPCALLSLQPLFQEKKDSFIFYVGSFEPRKNIAGILQAFAKVKKEGFPHQLILAGKEEGPHRLPWKLIRDLGIENHIIHKGYVTEGEKKDLLKRASLLVWPSFYEGFGIPLLEAMASGTPIVTSDLGSMKEIVGDAALCADPYDVNAIANGMMEILSSENLAQILMGKGKIRSQNFSLQGVGKKLVSLYSSLIFPLQ